jgi:hypothetical protein
MRKLILGVLFTILFLTLTAQAQTKNAQVQTDPVHITGGKIFLTNQFDPANTRFETPNFTVVSYLYLPLSPWENVCPFVPQCTLGKTIIAPSQNSSIDLGGCIGDCNHFVRGTFTINGNTYQNVYFDGYLNISQVEFYIPRVAQRKGFLRLKKPFALSGHLQVCEISNIQFSCPADKILYEGDIVGKGNLTLTLEIKMFHTDIRSTTFGWQKSFDYVFE